MLYPFTKILRTPGDADGGDAGSPPPAAAAPEPANGTGAGQGSFSQEDVNRIAAQARESARSKATKDLLAELGFEDADSLKTSVTSWKQHSEGQKSELQKAQDRLAALESADSQRKELEAAVTTMTEVLQANVEATLKSLNVAPHIQALIKDMSPVNALSYLTQHADALRAAPPPDIDGSKAGADVGQTTEQRRAALKGRYRSLN